MKLNRVLVVYKRGTAAREAKFARMHGRAIEAIEDELSKLGIRARLIERGRVRSGTAYDLIVTVGGDGTVISAAHMAGTTPILGVNSMPGRSVGFFCGATADCFGAMIEGIARGEIRPKQIPLIEARIGRKALSVPALNDILFSGRTPAEMVRYRIIAGGRSERQRSSGIWIAAGPGSSAAILSAGGRRLPISSRRLQFVVREPFAAAKRRFKMTRRLLKPGQAVAIESETGDGMIYIDGPRIAHPLTRGQRLTARAAGKRLKIFL